MFKTSDKVVFNVAGTTEVMLRTPVYVKSFSSRPHVDNELRKLSECDITYSTTTTTL